MRIFSRRKFLRASAVTSLSLGLNAASPAFFRRQLLAGDGDIGNKKLVFIFQRGGSDALNTCIPHGDSAYST